MTAPKSADPANRLYSKNECKGGSGVQAEAIAQARLLARLNSAGVFQNSATAGGITANAQWEVRYPKSASRETPPGPRRVDLMLYDRTNPSGAMELVELKRRRSPSSEPDAVRQIGNYQRDLPAGSAQRAVELHDFGGPRGYGDRFRVLRQDCGETGVTSRLLYQYQVKVAATSLGLLMIDREEQETECPEEGEPQLPPVLDEETRVEEVQEDTDDPFDPPREMAFPGRDDDEDDKDDFYEDLRANVPELYEVDSPPLPEVGVPAGSTVLVDTRTIAVIVAIVALCTAFCAGVLAAAVVVEAGSVSLGVAVGVLAGLLAGLASWNVWGDPHLVTLDRLQYDLQSVGEFHLLELPDAGIDVQARFKAVGPNLSVLDRVATVINDQRIEIGNSWAKIDGKDLNLPNGGAHVLGDGAVLTRDARGYMLVWPGGGDQRLALMGSRNSVGFFVPPAAIVGSPRGLLGNHDGDPTNDLALRDGTPLPASASSATLHGAFADSWRVSDDESLFSYAAGQSTATFTDRSAPQNVVTTGDFSGAEVEAATATCSQAGVEPGPQFDACVLDILVTGDSTYADAAALVTDVIVSASGANFDDRGRIAVDFEGSVPPNFVASRYSSDATTSRIGGPLFDKGGYRFYVRNVGRHDAVSLGTDVYAFGAVADDGQPQSVALTVNKQERGSIFFDGGEPRLSAGMPGSLVRTGSGVSAAGQSFMRWRLQVPLGRVGESLDAEFTPMNFSGVLSTSLGFDNIDLALDTPAAQRFAATEPFSIPGGPGSGLQNSDGAGVLESPGAADVYEFDVTASQSGSAHVLNTQSCSSPLTYTLTRQDTSAVIGRWANTCSRISTPTLDAGSYALAATPYASAATGTYALQLFPLPQPQRFAYTFGTTVSDGVPAAGAGNLETVASQDVYSFSASGGDAYLDHRSCFSGERWELRVQGTATVVAAGNCLDRPLGGLAAGDYELTVSTVGTEAGSYSLQLFATPVAPQDFTAALSLTVSDQRPSTGAGNLETKQSVDRYSFAVTTPAPLYIDVQACLDSGDLAWRLVSTATGSVAGSGGCADAEIAALPAGEYRLEISSGGEGAGPYEFQAWLVPMPPQDFAVTIPAIIAPDRPVAGAGNLETKASQDIYRFSLPEGKSALYIDQITCSRPGLLTWKLVSDVNGNAVTFANGSCKDQQVRQLARGDYRLVVTPVGESHGTYGLRIAASETGSPAIVHNAQITAYYGQTIPIDVTTGCRDASACFARLYYRMSSASSTAGIAGLAAGSWTMQDLTLAGSTTGAGLPLASWKGTVPASAVTTTGIDYYLTAGDGDNRNELPTASAAPLGLTGAATNAGAAVAEAPYLHITTVSPPLLTHLSPVYAYADTSVPLELKASCSTGSCSARLHYRPASSLAAGTGELFSDPGWSTIAMTQTAMTPLGVVGSLVTYAATIPGANVDTRGVDYYFDVTDTRTTSYWPGTSYQGYYAPRDGMRTAYQTIHVLEPPHIVHVPVTTTSYRAATAITATANCLSTRTCTGRLYYRTTTNNGIALADGVLTAQDFTNVAMSVNRVSSLIGNDVIALAATIPAAFADTRGIDYFFRVDDGSSTTWFPGAGPFQGYVNIDGIRVAFQHIRVLEAPHITSVPILTTKALEPYTVTSEMTCVTESCSMTLHWRNDLAPGEPDTGWHDAPMTRTGDPLVTPLGTQYTYGFTIPAEKVTTRGLAYYLEGYDSYVHDYAPGTSYWGAYLPLDGQRIDKSAMAPNGNTLVVGSFLVRVLEPPHLVHAPPGLVEKGQPLTLTATSNCSSSSCPATLTWTGSDGQRRTVVMTAVRQVNGGAVNPAVPGDLWQYSVTIPATDTTGTVFYSMAITDGYTSDATLGLQALVYERPAVP